MINVTTWITEVGRIKWGVIIMNPFGVYYFRYYPGNGVESKIISTVILLGAYEHV